jgi:hypothetical protein
MKDEATQWWCLHQGIWKPLGKHNDFDEAAEKADAEYPGNAWILDQEGMDNMRASLEHELRVEMSTTGGAELRRLINSYVDASVEAGWAGCKTPQEARELRKDVEQSRAALYKFIRTRTVRKTNG